MHDRQVLSSSLRALVSSLLIGLIPLLVFMGCEGDYRPRAVGEEGEVTVVMDSSHWTGPVGEALRENVTPWVETLPSWERYFDIRHLELSSERTFDSIQDLKNVIIIAPLSDTTNEATFLERRLSEDAREAVLNGQTAVVSKPDLWRRSQRVFFITAASPEGLVQALQEQGPQVRQSFQEVTLERMEREMYDKARRHELEDSLMDRHGFAVNVQHDFQLAIDSLTESTGFIWLRRILAKTRREFFVHYFENASPEQITPEWIFETRDSLTRQYYQGNVDGFIRIDYRRPLEAREVNVVDRYGFESRGLWHMVAETDTEGEFRSMGQGGPFVNYTFYDQESDRIYMLDGSVFAPGYDKLELLRQMEVMAKTFRTAEEIRSPEDRQVAASQSN